MKSLRIVCAGVVELNDSGTAAGVLHFTRLTADRGIEASRYEGMPRLALPRDTVEVVQKGRRIELCNSDISSPRLLQRKTSCRGLSSS